MMVDIFFLIFVRKAQEKIFQEPVDTLLYELAIRFACYLYIFRFKRPSRIPEL